MARPTYNIVIHGQQSWDADLNDNFTVLGSQSIPIPEYANFGSLPNAALNDRCLAATTDTNSLYFSDGTNWLLVPRGAQALTKHSYPWGIIRGAADADSIFHYPGWTLTEDSSGSPALNNGTGEEKDGGTGRRTTFVEFDVFKDDGVTVVLDLRIALPEGFSLFGTDGLKLFHRISTMPASGAGDSITVKIEVFDPTTAGDTVVAATTRTISHVFPAADANYVAIQIAGSVLNGIGNPHQAEDMLHLRITLDGVQATGMINYVCRLGKLELNMR